MNLQEKLTHQVQELYIDIPDSSVDLVQENTKGNVVALRTSGIETTLDVVPTFAISLAEARNRVKLMQEFIKDMMVPGVDYGQIPGCLKPSLFKSGAEKLCDIFGFSKQVEVINRTADWEKGIFSYEIKVILINKRTGFIEAEGLGFCNTMEKKYLGQDAYSISGTVLKMAKKRALVDAVLSATRSSDLFTQDVEDTIVNNEPPIPVTPIVHPRESSIKLASDKQLKMISSLVSEIGLPEVTVHELLVDKYQVNTRPDLNTKQASDFIKYLLEIKG